MGWVKNVLMLTIIINLFLTFASYYVGSGLFSAAPISSELIDKFMKNSSNLTAISYNVNLNDTATVIGDMPKEAVNPNTITNGGGTLNYTDPLSMLFAGMLLIFNLTLGVYYLWFYLLIPTQMALFIGLPFMIAYTLALYQFFRTGEL